MCEKPFLVSAALTAAGTAPCPRIQHVFSCTGPANTDVLSTCPAHTSLCQGLGSSPSLLDICLGASQGAPQWGQYLKCTKKKYNRVFIFLKADSRQVFYLLHIHVRALQKQIMHIFMCSLSKIVSTWSEPNFEKTSRLLRVTRAPQCPHGAGLNPNV